MRDYVHDAAMERLAWWHSLETDDDDDFEDDDEDPTAGFVYEAFWR